MKLSRSGALAIVALCLSPGAYANEHGPAYAAVKAIVDYCSQVEQHYTAHSYHSMANIAKLLRAEDLRASMSRSESPLGFMPMFVPVAPTLPL